MHPLKKLSYGIVKKFKFLNPEYYLKIYYQYYTDKKLDLENPTEFNQKIQWMKIYYQKPILSILVDKYSVREYIKDKIGDQYLNDLIKVYERASDVNFNELPEKFVLKAVHGSNYNIIVKDKKKLNRLTARWKMHKWMGRNYYYSGGLEWAYKNVTPRIICEKFLNEIGKESINDYKFFCFNGVPKFIQIDIDRHTDHSRCFYDIDWKKLPFSMTKYKHYQGEVEKPEKFDEMFDLVKRLAEDFPFVRVDFYAIGEKIIFGEMTFYPGDGIEEFYPDEYNTTIGNYLQLPEKIV
ncbi:glycosyltransferase [Leptobacterium flavescens]|uniref:Glycosyltransferase n=1 Tax=Leptobacterium flavescens TaxID=472055 RepID=A0A6P0UQ77_9FLAO|nr:ATP-grasp fold amidoligase family protein [Leptobacterium flavescens]NER15514.1 glycosyltransferase [Leptobacterium flavescens]